MDGEPGVASALLADVRNAYRPVRTVLLGSANTAPSRRGRGGDRQGQGGAPPPADDAADTGKGSPLKGRVISNRLS